MKKNSPNYYTITAILFSGIAIAGALFLFEGNKDNVNTNAVKSINGKEVIQMTAKNGFNPTSATIHGGNPAILELQTNGTFDCSSGIRIPSLGITQLLPSTGSTQIEIPAQKAGTQINGTCSMGMYHFTINVI